MRSDGGAAFTREMAGRHKARPLHTAIFLSVIVGTGLVPVRLETFPANSIGSLPEHDQRRTRRLVINRGSNAGLAVLGGRLPVQ